MSADKADGSAKQFDQSVPAAAEAKRWDSTSLHDQYKPVGISAVSAAAQFTAKAKKKTSQMS